MHRRMFFKVGDKVRLSKHSPSFSGEVNDFGILTIFKSVHVDLDGEVWHDFEEVHRRFRDIDLRPADSEESVKEPESPSKDVEEIFLSIPLLEGVDHLGGKFRASNGELYSVSLNKVPPMMMRADIGRKE